MTCGDRPDLGVRACSAVQGCTVLRVAGTVHHLGGPQAHWLASMLAMRQGRELSVLPGRAGR